MEDLSNTQASDTSAMAIDVTKTPPRPPRLRQTDKLPPQLALTPPRNFANRTKNEPKRLDKDEDFLGKQAYIDLKDRAPREKLVVLSVQTPHNADPVGGEPIFSKAGEYIGRVSSGGYSYTTDQGLALGFLKAPYCEPGQQVDVAALGIPHAATVLEHPPFDPTGSRLRG